MSLIERINDDLKDSMKNKDTFRLNVIRMVKGAIQLEKINKKKDLDDNDVIDIVGKQIKMRNDSINEFKKANRELLVSQNEKEITILNEYMPTKISDEEVNEIIDKAIVKIKPTSSKDMGLVMREVTPQVKGRADMSMVSTIIKEKLSNL